MTTRASVHGGHKTVRSAWRTGNALLPPQYAFALAALIAAGAVWLCLMAVLQSPWFGIQLDRDPQRVGIVQAVDQTAAATGLAPGDRVTAFAAPDGEPVPLEPLSLVSDLDHAGGFTERAALLAHLARLYEATRHSTARVTLDDGRELTLERTRRALTELPAGVWVLVAGIIPFLVGAGVWSYRDGHVATRLLLLAGASFMLIALSNLLYAYRQPTIDPQLLQYAVHANRLGTFLFFFSYVALFWSYPFRLGSIYVVHALLAIAALLFVNEITQTIEWPGDPFAFPVVISLPFCLAFIAMQWWLSRERPVERAVLQWFALSMMVGMILVTGLYFLPGLLGAEPVLALELAFAVGVISYLGLMLAVVRYRLFQLDLWWLSAWMWLLGGSAIVALDLLIAHLLNIASTYVIVASIFIVGWLYFPVRQWLWRRLFWRGQSPMEWVPAELFEAIVAARDAGSLRATWASLLQRMFHPLQLAWSADGIESPYTGEEGLTLHVPDLVGDGTMKLSCRNAGRRLFSPDDARLVASLLQMIRPALQGRQSREAARRIERERIMRDLHDDVAARLLTLTRRLTNPADAASVQAALDALRETIYRLHRPEGSNLKTALADWRFEFAERLDSHHIEFAWDLPDELGDIKLDANSLANLGQILREAVSNAIRHAAPGQVTVTARRRPERLCLAVIHDGARTHPDHWQAGTGIANIRYRVRQLGGEVCWRMHDGQCECQWWFPVDTGHPGGQTATGHSSEGSTTHGD